MNRRIKISLILIFVLLFFLGCPGAIFYSRGYRFDFETRKIVKTGGFSFRTSPKSCEIYLNGKLKKKTDFLLGESFIKNLIPKKYDVNIKKAGYFPWEKTLEIREGFVTEAKNIILFPKNLNFSTLSSEVEDYFFSPDGKKMIVKKINEEKWTLDIFDLERNSQEHLLEKAELSSKRIQLNNLSWSFDSRRILLETEIEGETKYFVIDNLEENRRQVFSLNYGSIQKVAFSSIDSQEILFLRRLNGTRNLFQADFSNQKLPNEILKNLISYKINEGDIFWLSHDGFLNRSNFSGQKIETLNEIPFSLKEGSEYEIEVLDWVIFLKEDGSLYQLNQSSGAFEKITDSTTNLKLSQDSKKLVIANNYEIWILFLEEINEQPRRQNGQKIFLTRFSQKIGEIFWLGNNYLIFDAGNKIKIAEVDDRDRINIIELSDFEDPKIAWSQELETIYLLSDKTLYYYNNLLP